MYKDHRKYRQYMEDVQGSSGVLKAYIKIEKNHMIDDRRITVHYSASYHNTLWYSSLSNLFLNGSVSQIVFESFRTSAHSLTCPYPPVCLSIYLIVCLSDYLFVCVCVCVCVCLFVYLSACLSVCLIVFMPLYLFVSHLVYQNVISKSEEK